MTKGCLGFARSLLVLLTVLFIVIGSVVSGLVIYMQLSEPFYGKAIPIIAKYVCLGLHIGVFLSGLIGLCAAFWQKKWLFSIFVPIMILTYASHLALAASLMINSSLVKDTIGEAIDSWQRGYKYNGNGDAVVLMDEIHKQFLCCGSHSYKEYRLSTTETLQIPWSCCNAEKLGIAECQPKSYSLPFELAYERGCRSVATESSWKVISIVLYASVGVTALEILTVILALSMCCLCIEPRDTRRNCRRYSALPLPDGFPPGGHETVL